MNTTSPTKHNTLQGKPRYSDFIAAHTQPRAETIAHGTPPDVASVAIQRKLEGSRQLLHDIYEKARAGGQQKFYASQDEMVATPEPQAIHVGEQKRIARGVQQSSQKKEDFNKLSQSMANSSVLTGDIASDEGRPSKFKRPSSSAIRATQGLQSYAKRVAVALDKPKMFSPGTSSRKDGTASSKRPSEQDQSLIHGGTFPQGAPKSKSRDGSMAKPTAKKSTTLTKFGQRKPGPKRIGSGVNNLF